METVSILQSLAATAVAIAVQRLAVPYTVALVFTEEPPPPDHSLLGHERVVVTPTLPAPRNSPSTPWDERWRPA